MRLNYNPITCDIVLWNFVRDWVILVSTSVIFNGSRSFLSLSRSLSNPRLTRSLCNLYSVPFGVRWILSTGVTGIFRM